MNTTARTWAGIGLALMLLPATACFDEEAVQDEAETLYEACITREEHDALLARVVALEQAGFLVAETDPAFSASVSAGITADQVTAWDEAHDWGDHGQVGYLTAESDPLFDASAASLVSLDDIEDWDDAWTWGDHAAAGYATVTELEAAMAALEACPPGLLQDLTETRFVLCYDPDTDPAAPDEMVQVGDFWIDRYEAAVWSDPDCSGTQYGASGDGYPSDFPDTGAWTTRVYACSTEGVLPSRYLTWFQAQQACSAAGKALCTNEQWQAAAAGTWDPGENDGVFGGACNTQTLTADPRATGLAGGTLSGQDSCISAWGVEDLVGNAREWVADWEVAGANDIVANESHTDPWPVTYADDRTWNLGGRANTAAGYVEGLPATVVRGGHAWMGLAAGTLSIDMRSSPTVVTDNHGFRCCR